MFLFFFILCLCFLYKKINSSNEEKLLGIASDSRLNFDFHITSFLKKAGQKLCATTRLNKSLTHPILKKITIKFSGKISIQLLSTDLDALNKRALHLIYCDYETHSERTEESKQKILNH